jgi:hypothetical protein
MKPLAPGIIHSHFKTHGEARQQQLLAWRERVGHIIDVPPSLAELEQPFNASIERYALGELVVFMLVISGVVAEQAERLAPT